MCARSLAVRRGDAAPGGGGGPATCSGDTGEPSVGTAGYTGAWATPLLHTPLPLPRWGPSGNMAGQRVLGVPPPRKQPAVPLLPACKQGSPSIHFRVLCPLVPPEKPQAGTPGLPSLSSGQRTRPLAPKRTPAGGSEHPTHLSCFPVLSVPPSTRPLVHSLPISRASF